MTERIEDSSSDYHVCPTCGTSLAADAERCVVCGTELRGAARSRSTRGPARITLTVPIALAFFAFFSILSAGLTYIVVTRVAAGAETALPAETPTMTATVTLTPEPTPTETPIPSPTALPTLEYIVVEFDTCVGIAVRFDISFRALLLANPQLTDQCILSVNQRLNIPQPTPTASPEPTATLPPEEATEAACEKIDYTVEANDTLSGIAENYNVDPRAIIDYNGMTSETVFIGQLLKIPLCERLPTPGPSPTATPPPPQPAPNLLLPPDGAAFTLANDTVTLQWAAVGELREDEVYRVSVEDITEGSGTVKIVAFVTDTKYIVPTSFRPPEITPHVMRWWVQVVRQEGTTDDGDPIYVSGGVVSKNRDFTWSGAAPAASPTP
jgi:LysM repeat protein